MAAAECVPTYRDLIPGDVAPWFHAPVLAGNPRYAFDTAAGRPVVMLLLGSAGQPAAAAALRLIARHRADFDDASACLFGVTVDPQDAATQRIATAVPGIRWFLDYDGAVSRSYGALPMAGEGAYRPHWLLLDPGLRVLAREPLGGGARIMAALAQAKAEAKGDQPPAPVLTVPRVLEPALCARLIALYKAQGGTESGFMREENGITVMRTDPGHKRRSDVHITDPALIAALRARLNRFVRPMIARAFHFDVTRVERWLIACYDGESGGHFRAHRDNTTKGTAHRRFACTINLNAGDYEGGALRFPEYGPHLHRPATGAALIFSCSMLHEALPVTAGRRYALLPFFYDEAAAQQRERNLAFVSDDLAGYRAGGPAGDADS